METIKDDLRYTASLLQICCAREIELYSQNVKSQFNDKISKVNTFSDVESFESSFKKACASKIAPAYDQRIKKLYADFITHFSERLKREVNQSSLCDKSMLSNSVVAQVDNLSRTLKYNIFTQIDGEVSKHKLNSYGKNVKSFILGIFKHPITLILLFVGLISIFSNPIPEEVTLRMITDDISWVPNAILDYRFSMSYLLWINSVVHFFGWSFTGLALLRNYFKTRVLNQQIFSSFKDSVSNSVSKSIQMDAMKSNVHNNILMLVDGLESVANQIEYKKNCRAIGLP